MTQSEGYKPDLVGKRVKHNCDDPDCTIQGIVLDVVYHSEESKWLASIKFDSHEGMTVDYTQLIPVSLIKVIEDE